MRCSSSTLLLMKKIILASTSPQRRKLLQKLNIPFETEESDYEEDLTLKLSPEELVKKLSLGKASVVAKNHHDAVVIGADTIIVFNGIVMGKPHTKEKALEMLQKLNGNEHVVITGYTIIDTENNKVETSSVITKVLFHKVEEGKLEEYVNSGEALDKAGAYAIQGNGAFLVKSVEGEYTNVIGLPLISLASSLSHFGISATYDETHQ